MFSAKWREIISMYRNIDLKKLATCFHADSLLGSFFYPEDGGDMFP
jgi:hypothetical protein